MSKLFQLYGVGQGLFPVLPPPIPFENPPTSYQTNYEIGQLVFSPPVNPNAFWFYGGGGNWIEIASSAGDVLSVTGTANQILANPTTGAVVLSLIGPYTPATYTAHGVLIGEGTGSIVATTPGTNGQLLIGSTGADPAFSTVTTTTGLVFTPGAHTLAIDITNGGYLVLVGTGGAIVTQTSNVVSQSAQASFSLPAVAAVGSMFLIASAHSNTGGWIITQGSGQEIWLNTSHTTNGPTGTLAGAVSTSVVIMCTVANTEFIVVGGTGATGLTFT
jgi:hypothetical protein